MRVLVTGSAGFIGSNFVINYLKSNPEDEVIVVDKLTYAGKIENIKPLIDTGKIEFIKEDINNIEKIGGLKKDPPSVIINFAAETHVDNSIKDPSPFYMSNILGVVSILEFARRHDVDKVVQISTDEVYGATKSMEVEFSEEDKLNPSSPYSASKASGDLLAEAYYKTYGLNVSITRSSNNYGPYQFPEKLIPKTIIRALYNKPIPVYGSGKQFRDWIHVRDNCNAIEKVAKKGKPGEVYNISAGEKIENITVVKRILDILGKGHDLIEHVNDRPGHDWGYSITNKKLIKLGWKPSITFKEGIQLTVDWYVSNKWWWVDSIKSTEWHW